MDETMTICSDVGLAQFAAIAVPFGSILPFAGANAPAGYLLCNGAAVSRTDYVDLFAAIGTVWGDGDGETTFNLPDLRGEFLRGFDNGRGVDADRAFASAQADEFKSHTHPGHFLKNNGIGKGLNEASGSLVNYDGQVEPSGGSETRPRNVAVNFVVKAFYPSASTGE